MGIKSQRNPICLLLFNISNKTSLEVPKWVIRRHTSKKDRQYNYQREKGQTIHYQREKGQTIQLPKGKRTDNTITKGKKDRQYNYQREKGQTIQLPKGKRTQRLTMIHTTLQKILKIEQPNSIKTVSEGMCSSCGTGRDSLVIDPMEEKFEDTNEIIRCVDSKDRQ